MTPPATALAHAVDAAERADWPACLSSLLDAWRAASHPALADAIDRVSAKLTVAAVPARKLAIRARLAAATDADVAALLDMLLREVRTAPGLYAHVVALSERPRDPRVARALADLIQRPAFAVSSGAPYKALVEALDRVDDPRFRQLILDQWRRLETQRGRMRKYRSSFDLVGRLAESVRRRPAPPPLSGLTTALRRIDAALALTAARRRAETRSASELLAAIYDDPHDLALRLVYADALQVDGDPRGEFVALQCGRADDGPISRRERDLLSAYGRIWLGAIEPIVLKHGLVYRRGFPTCVREARDQISHRALLDAIEWRTVEEIELRESAELAVKFLADRKKPLRRVWQLYGEDLLDLVAQQDLLPWHTLGLRSALSSEWQDIARLDALPNLVELDLTEVHGALFVLRTLAGGPLVRPLRRLRLATRHYAVPDLIASARPLAPELELVYEYTFPGAPDGDAVRIAGDRLTLVHPKARIDATYAVEIVSQLAPGSLRAVTLEAPPGARLVQPAWNQLGALLATHGLALPPPPPRAS